MVKMENVTGQFDLACSWMEAVNSNYKGSYS
jgi:hypothetical protein